jgi:Uma2 family endonuclease
MSATTPTQPAHSPPISEAVDASENLYRMSVDEYERIGELLDDSRVELIDGLLVAKMVKNPPHQVACVLAHQALAPVTPSGWHLRLGDPIRIPRHNEPEPDVSLVRGGVRDYTGGHVTPADVGLVVEVSDTTLAKDRRRAQTYGPGGVPVYWIVNLVDRQIEVYLGPSSAGYSSRVDFGDGQNVPVVIEGVEVGRIAVADVLP